MSHPPIPYGLNGNPVTDDDLLIPMGVYEGVSCINKFGASAEAAADTATVVWDGGATYPFPATALMTSLSQTTDQSALRGALINVQGLDADWNPITQIVPLDATLTTNVVTLPTPLIRCFRMILMGNTAGTSAIRVHNAGETVDYAIITAGLNQTLMAVYTIPDGYTGYMSSYYTSVTSETNKIPTSTEVRLQTANRAHGDIFTIAHAFAIPKLAPGFQYSFSPYDAFTERTDLLIEVTCHDWPAHIHAGFDIILIKNDRSNP